MPKLHVNQIEQMNLDGKIKDLHEKGMSVPKIHEILVKEGFDVKLSSVRYHIETRITRPKKETRKETEEKRKTNALYEMSPELKLTEAITEAWGKYEAVKDSPGKEREASDWFKIYSEMVEKLMKSTGVYERAKQEVQRDDDKRIEIYWVLNHTCPNCGTVFQEDVEVNSVMTYSDMQIEDMKEDIVDKMTEQSVEVDGKKNANPTV